MKKILLLTLINFFSITLYIHVSAQNFNLYEKHVYVQENDTLPYRLLLPEGFDKNKKYPLIIFLHGAGERGNDNEKQLTHGASLFLKDENRKKYPAYVVFPQCRSTSYWSNVKITSGEKGHQFIFQEGGMPTKEMQMVMALLRNLYERFPVQKDRVYVIGLSMGGMGTFELVNRMPNTFAAAAPICGGAHIGTAKNLKETSWWVFHGAKDDVVPPEFSKEMVAAMIKHKVNVKFTLYPEANHNSWDAAFAEPALLEWMFNCKKK